MKSLNSLERCMAVLNGETPDRLPIVPQCFMLAVETAGMKISDVNRNDRKMAQAHIISQEKYGYDGCVIDFDDATIAEAVGAKVVYREDKPAIVDEEQPVLKDLRDVYDMPIPDLASSGRLNEWLEATRTLSEAIGDHVFIMGRADQAPFSIACLLRGTTQFMMDLLTEDKQLIDDVLEYCRKISAVFAKAQKDAGAHVTSIGDTFAGPNLISPDMYRQYALIPEQKLAKEVQDYGIPFSIHICGNTNGIIQDMGTTGAKILEVDWMLDIKEARRLVPEDTVLMGNIDPSTPLVLGTPSDVDAAVKRLIEATKGKRHIISSGCAMGRNTPPENFKAFIEAAHRYDSYEEIIKLQNL
ncbi:MAG: uroporphyrinogen decarboxylase family protein [Parabacteroides sp.]|nr:uroporphyrinogen decarboxylase family protein [Parabacteroides sp.]